jgi:hypothetical protein
MIIYTPEQLKLIKERYPLSIFKKIKRINSFIDSNWDKYIEAVKLNNQGQTNWSYSVSLNDLKFFENSQENILDKLV